MDELTLMRSFGAERVKRNPTTRIAARRALDAEIEAACADPAPIATPIRRRGALLRRRRVLGFAAAFAAGAAAVAGILVLGSGPTAEPAAARILHETAAVAASPNGPTSTPLPAPGQFFYRKFKRLELASWVPGGEYMGGGEMTRPGAFTAVMPTTQERWEAPDGAGRTREVAGSPRFLTEEEQARWEAAGSRLPAPFDPEYQRKYPLAFKGALELRRGVVDTGHGSLKGFRFPDTSRLPTEPEALRLAVESNRISVGGFNPMNPSAKRLDAHRTIAELFNILSEGYVSTPRLRAAVFNALAELPEIKVDTDAADFLGRHGYAIRSIDPKTWGGVEFIFDPDTAEILAERSFLGRHERSPFMKGLPPGQTIRETAFLEAGVVDSVHATVAEADAGR